MSVGRFIMYVLAAIPLATAVDQCPAPAPPAPPTCFSTTLTPAPTAAITGKCAGNTNSAEDVACGAGATNKGSGTAGTDTSACCEDITGKCTGNKVSSTDVTCTGAKVNRGVFTTGNSTDSCCIEPSTMCCGNSASTDDMTDALCGAGKYFRGTLAMRSTTKSTVACCADDITGRCTGNTNGVGDVSCASGKKNKGVVGTDDSTCCVDSCQGYSSCASGKHLKSSPETIEKGGSPETTCCSSDITGKCSGNTGGTGDVTCGPKQNNKGVGTAGTTTAACCEDRTKMCTNNAVASEDVDCATECKTSSGGCEAAPAAASASYNVKTNSCPVCCSAPSPSGGGAGGATASHGQKLQPHMMGLVLAAVGALMYST